MTIDVAIPGENPKNRGTFAGLIAKTLGNSQRVSGRQALPFLTEYGRPENPAGLAEVRYGLPASNDIFDSGARLELNKPRRADCAYSSLKPRAGIKWNLRVRTSRPRCARHRQSHCCRKQSGFRTVKKSGSVERVLPEWSGGEEYSPLGFIRRPAGNAWPSVKKV